MSSPPSRGPSFGITEDNADLLWNPGAPAPATAQPFLPSRRALTALRPRYIRLLVDWAALQPDPARPPALAAPVDGCARGVGPCGAYDGLAGELAAIASQQRAANAAGAPGFEVVLDVFGVPTWAARAASGCEVAGATAFARALAPAAVSAYKKLIADLVALARQQGVSLPWWSPWNEPNDPRFLGPQRKACSREAAPAASAIYAQLARAMGDELKAADPDAQMILGELGGYQSGSPHRLSVAEFVSALPADVLCLGHVWAIHAYAARGPGADGGDPVAALEAALHARGGCAASAAVWITESGAGAPEPGRPRGGAAGEEAAACRALAAQLLAWRADPKVGAIFQYEFRDDPAYPVGLASADLTRLDSDYRLWLAFGQRSASPSSVCDS